MATWCYDKDYASNCCSTAVWGSMYRSMTYSFGSICFGSLLQSIMTAIRVFIDDARNRQQQRIQANAATSSFNSSSSFAYGEATSCCGFCGICYCIVECMAKVFDKVMHYFHQWAYVYVGIYGYSYLKSGKMVLELFVQRGWTAIIADNLVNYVFNCLTCVMAIMNGIVSILVLNAVDTGYHKDFYDIDGGHNGIDSDDLGNDFVAKWDAFVAKNSKNPTSDPGDHHDPASFVFGPVIGRRLYAFM